MNRKLGKWMGWISGLTLLLLVVAAFSFSVGSAGIPASRIIPVILKGRSGVDYSILVDIRLPRIMLGFSVGGALALSGVVLQGVFRNPLVEPYTLGISGGAALGAALSIVFKLARFSVFTLPLCGFAGAILVVVLVYSLSVRKGVLKIQGLLLTGVMLSFISSSLIMLIMAVSSSEDLRQILFWTMGSLEEPNTFLIKTAFWISVFGLITSYFFATTLNAFALGEEEAKHLGVDTETAKRLLLAIASLLTGFSVALGGIIGFVGLVVPHFMRMFVGVDHRILLISSFLGGAAFLIFCDTIARTMIAPMELPVGVITGILGGILFIYTLTKRTLMLGGE